MDEGAGEVDLLAHAGGVVGDERGAGVPQAEDVEELGGARGNCLAVEASQAPGVGDEVEAAESV